MDMSSDLEFMVETDMLEKGYNPYCDEDIELYWEEHLDGY